MSNDGRTYTTRRTVLGAAGSATLVALAGCVGDDDDEDDGAAATGTSTVTLLVEHADAGGHDHDDGHDDHDHDDGHDDDGPDYARSSGEASARYLGSHDDDHDHDDHGDHPVDIDHACNHFEFNDAEGMDGGGSPDDAPTISTTHDLFDVTFEGESGYVVFEAGHDDHDHDDGHDDDHDHDDGHDDDHDHDDGHDDDHDHDHDDDHDHDHGGDAFAFFTDGGSVSVVEGHAFHEERDGVPGCEFADMYVAAEPDHGRVVLELSA